MAIFTLVGVVIVARSSVLVFYNHASLIDLALFYSVPVVLPALYIMCGGLAVLVVLMTARLPLRVERGAPDAQSQGKATEALLVIELIAGAVLSSRFSQPPRIFDPAPLNVTLVALSGSLMITPLTFIVGGLILLPYASLARHRHQRVYAEALIVDDLVSLIDKLGQKPPAIWTTELRKDLLTALDCLARRLSSGLPARLATGDKRLDWQVRRFARGCSDICHAYREEILLPRSDMHERLRGELTKALAASLRGNWGDWDTLVAERKVRSRPWLGYALIALRVGCAAGGVAALAVIQQTKWRLAGSSLEVVVLIVTVLAGPVLSKTSKDFIDTVSGLVNGGGFSLGRPDGKPK